MMKFKTVVLCFKLLTCLIVQRSFGDIAIAAPEFLLTGSDHDDNKQD